MIYMHVLAVYVKEGLPFTQDLSQENSADFYLCFRLSLLHSTLFPLSITFFVFCMVFYSISSNIDEVLSINPSTVFVFGDFNNHRKVWPTYSGGTDQPGELLYFFHLKLPYLYG